MNRILAIGCQNLRRNMMTKLYTFGCSYTFGQGLDDLPKSFKNNPTPISPSKLVWTNHVATALGYELVNLAVPGISNRQIVHIVLNELPYIDPKGKVIIHWTHIGRKMIFTDDPSRCNGPGKTFKNVRHNAISHIEKISPWIKTETSENYYKHIGNEFDWCHDAIMLMDYIDLKLKQHGVSKVLHLGPAVGANIDSISTLLNGLQEDLYISKMYRDETVIHLMKIDKAKHDSHPGIKTQHKYAQHIIKEHGEYLNG